MKSNKLPPKVKCLRAVTLNLNDFSDVDSADGAHKAEPACANHGGCQIPSELAWPLAVNSNNRHITKFLYFMFILRAASQAVFTD